MKHRIIFLATLAHLSLMTPAYTRTTTSYQTQRAQLAQQLNALAPIAQSTPPASKTLAAPPAPIAPAPDPRAQAIAPAPDPRAQAIESAVMLFMQAVSEHHGPSMTQVVAPRIMSSPSHLKAIVMAAQKHGKNLHILLKDKQTIMAFLEQPNVLSTIQPKSSRVPSVKGLLSAMNQMKKYFSVREWGQLTQGFIGNLFSQLWHQIWRTVGRAITVVVGTGQIYELNDDGSLKRDQHGNKLPKMVREVSIGQMGQPEEHMVPNKWFDIVENEQGLLSHIAQSGIDRATKSTLRSLDRLMFRPLVSRFIQVPFWKLSHTQYVLAMHERKYPNQSLLEPSFLATKIKETKNPMLLFATGLPYSLRRILEIKSPHEKDMALQEAITKHVWDTYEKVWNEVTIFRDISGKEDEEHTITVADHITGKKRTIKATGDVTVMSKRGGKVTPMSLQKQVVDELENIGLDSLKGKLFDGPIAQYVMYANMAMSVPRMLFNSLGTGTKPALSGHEDKLAAIKIMENISRQIRDQRNETLSNDVGKIVLEFVVKNPHTNEEERIAIAPLTQKRLIAAQEKLIGKYRPFLEDTLSADPYEVYLKRLLFPRIMFQIIQKAGMNDKLGIHTLADAAKKMKDIEKHFNKTYSFVSALSSMLAMVKKFDQLDTFAGHYVEIADAIDRFLMSVSRTLGAFDVKKDDWGKRAKVLLRKTYGKHISVPYLKPRFNDWKNNWPFSALLIGDEKVFNATQRQQMQRAARKAGLYDLNAIMLDNEDAIKAYILDGEKDGVSKYQQLPHTFGSAQKESVEQGQARLRRAQRVQAGRHSSKALLAEGLTSVLTLASLKQFINNPSMLDLPRGKRNEVARRATDVILQTLFLLTARKGEEEDIFFTDGTGESDKRLAKTIAKMNAELHKPVRAMLEHLRAAIELSNELFVNYGLREILLAFDEHYKATGEKLSELPTDLIYRIALREGTAHAVGMGAQFLLGKAMKPVMAQISKLQGNALFGGPAVQGMLTGKIHEFVGGSGRRSNAYAAGRTLTRNIFNYGNAALSPQALMLSLGSQFTPGMSPGASQQQMLMAHAQMAAQSGRTPPAAIAAKLKALGMDTDMMGMESGSGAEEEDESSDQDNMLAELSEAANRVLINGHKIAVEKGQAAGRAYLKAEIKKLSEKDQELINQMIEL